MKKDKYDSGIAAMAGFPRDANQRGKRVVDIATGELPPPKPKDPNAVALGKKGGKAKNR